MVTDIERALSNGVAPWKEIEYRTTKFWIFKETGEPPEGYLCFVPVWTNFECLVECYRAAYKWGYQGIEDGKWEAFNIIQCIGVVSGQSVDYPYIHMVPRRTGDLE